MRFKEFLSEDREILDLESVLEKVRINCKPFLEQDRMLYRGFSPYLSGETVTRFDPNTAFYSPHPTNRKPRDSSAANHFNFCFNAGIDEAFGVENVRQKTVFATSSVDMAEIYGEVTFFFPVGDFKFITSDIITDSFEKNSDVFSMIGEKVGLENNELKAGFSTLAVEFKNSHDWLTNANKALVKTRDAFKSSDDQFYFKLKDTMKEVYLSLYQDTPNLSHFKFPTNGSELLFYETHGYYSIPITMVMNYVEANGIEMKPGLSRNEQARRALRTLIHHDQI